MWGAPSEFSLTLHQWVTKKLVQWRYLVWNKPLITVFRVIWLDISLSCFIFTWLWLCENKLACSWNISPYHTLTHVISILYIICIYIIIYIMGSFMFGKWCRNENNTYEIVYRITPPNCYYTLCHNFNLNLIYLLIKKNRPNLYAIFPFYLKYSYK